MQAIKIKNEDTLITAVRQPYPYGWINENFETQEKDSNLPMYKFLQSEKKQNKNRK